MTATSKASIGRDSTLLRIVAASDEQNAYFGLGPGGIAAVRLRDGQRQWFVSPPPAGIRVRQRASL